MKMKNLPKKIHLIILVIVLAILYYSCKEAPSDAPEIITKITGKVTDGQTNEALAGAQITTNPVTSSVITGEDGNYTIPNVSPGQNIITCLKDVYDENTYIVNDSEGQTVAADMQLIKLGPELSVSVQNLEFDVAN